MGGSKKRTADYLYSLDKRLRKLEKRLNGIIPNDESDSSSSSSDIELVSINQKPQEKDNTIQKDEATTHKGIATTQKDNAEPVPSTSGINKENGVDKSARELEKLLQEKQVLSPENFCIPTMVVQDEEMPYPGFEEILRLAYTLKGIPPRAMDTILACLSEATQKRYNATLSKWWQFRKAKDIFHASEQDIIDFLQQEMDQGANIERLNQHKTALNMVVQTSGNELIKNFLKGASNLQRISMAPMVGFPFLTKNYFRKF